MRILLLSNMYPSRERPDYGVFVQRLAEALRARGHELDEAVLESGARGRLRTPLAYLRLLGRARRLVRRTARMWSTPTTWCRPGWWRWRRVRRS